jgi:hypothetical protein
MFIAVVHNAVHWHRPKSDLAALTACYSALLVQATDHKEADMSLRLPVARRLALAAGLAGFLAIAPVWGNSAWAKSSLSPQAHHATHHPTKSATLSGKWSGKYSGSYSGTFTLTWQQSGDNLSGTIKISAFANAATPLKGTVHGKSITFGTVGSQEITYSGSFSGNTMSGTWNMQAGGQTMGSGPWQASRSS